MIQCIFPYKPNRIESGCRGFKDPDVVEFDKEKLLNEAKSWNPRDYEVIIFISRFFLYENHFLASGSIFLRKSLIEAEIFLTFR